MNHHQPFGLSAADRTVAAYGCHISTERLKREIAIAVWKWEVKRGLPHYDGRAAQFQFGSLTQSRKTVEERIKRPTSNAQHPTFNGGMKNGD